MNSEYKTQFRVLLKLLWVVVFACLYALGGIHDKWIRRFIAPLWLGGGMYWISKDWRTLLQIPFLIFGLHLGYGADKIALKLAKRAIVGFVLAGSNILHLLDKNFNFRRFWGILAWAMITIPASYLILGVVNPVSARAEELLLGLMVGLPSIFIIADKEKDDKLYKV